MRLIRSLTLAMPAVFALATAVPAGADTSPPAWSETEIVVKAARVPGPAVWRIQKGDAQVIVIGILPVFPKAQTWNPKRIQNALYGARALITPPASHASLGDMFTMMSAQNLPNGRKLKDLLPPALEARYEATAARAGVSIRPFVRDRPVWAGARLRRDTLNKLRLNEDLPAQTIIDLAHAQGVPVHAAANYRFSPILKDVNAMSDAASEACLGYALDDIDFDIDRAPKAAAAWAIGDIRTVHANYHGSTLMACLQESNQGEALMNRSIDDAVAAIDDALKTPGKTVAIFPMATLLQQGGTLDRLRAQGATISSPAE